ncbi:membrane bound O-acyl transferase family-domain-containing protein [Crassisporium funariophilum]|nr:membrane bound O-acyl transferase family-domain-containing protein [Crassisporium funariophilum]
MTERQKYHIILSFVVEGLSILAFAAKPSPYRKGFFIPIIFIVLYSLLFTSIEVGGVPENIGVGSRLMTALFFASTNILLSDVQRELRIVGQKIDISEAPFLSRLWWGITLWGNPRGVNYAHEPTRSLPPRPTHTSRPKFILSQLLWTALYLVAYDLARLVNRANPYNATEVPTITGYQWLWRFAAFGYLINILIIMEIEYMLASIVSVILGITSPRDWPATYGSLLDAYTVRRFWGKSWHQLFRRMFTLHAEYLARKLHLPKKSKFTTYFKLVVVFFMSGVLHFGGDYAVTQDWTQSGAIKCFVLQAAIIMFEDGFLALARRAGLTRPMWLTKIIGYLWVISCLAYTLPYWSDQGLRLGYMEAMDTPMIFGRLL